MINTGEKKQPEERREEDVRERQSGLFSSEALVSILTPGFRVSMWLINSENTEQNSGKWDHGAERCLTGLS